MLAAFFTGTRLGRGLAALGALALAVAGAFAAGWVRRGGADKAANAQREVATLKEVATTEDQVRSKSDAALADLLTRRK